MTVNGIADARGVGVPKRTDVPESYEEIVHHTMPELDMLGPSPSPPPTNRELANRVSTAFRADPRLIQTQIHVRANGSRVWLSGAAIGAGTVAYAADVAREVEGVSVVYNELGIDPDA